MDDRIFGGIVGDSEPYGSRRRDGCMMILVCGHAKQVLEKCRYLERRYL